MTDLCEGNLRFTFSAGWDARHYDEWPYYRNQLHRCFNSLKGIDILALDQRAGTLWMIEVKDYRLHRRTKQCDIVNEVAEKVVDTSTGLVAAAMNRHHTDHQFARDCLSATRLHVVLHLEQPMQHSKLFPRKYHLPNVTDKLRQKIKPFDTHPKVVEMADCPSLGWNVCNR